MSSSRKLKFSTLKYYEGDLEYDGGAVGGHDGGAAGGHDYDAVGGLMVMV